MARREKEFVYLDVQTTFTAGGLSSPAKYAQAAKEQNFKYLGTADRGLQWPVWERECAKRGVLAIFGWEARFSAILDRRLNRMTLMAANEDGLKTIYQLYQVNQHRDGGLEVEDLAAYTNGVVAVVPADTYGLVADVYKPENLYMEVTNFGDKQSIQELKAGLEKAREYEANLAGSNRPWRVKKRSMDEMISVLMQMNSLKDPKKLPRDWLNRETLPMLAMNQSAYIFFKQMAGLGQIDNRVVPLPVEGWLKPGKDMARLFKEVPEAVTATRTIAERCAQVRLPPPDIPEYPVAEGFTQDSWLTKLTRDEMENEPPENRREAEERLERELSVIRKMGVSSEFLFAKLGVDTCKEMGIRYNAVGSVTGSYTAYKLGITQVDPVEYELSFERFITLSTGKKPDIDMYIDAQYRDEFLAVMKAKLTAMGLEMARIAIVPKFNNNGATAMVMRMFGYSREEKKEIKDRFDQGDGINGEAWAVLMTAKELARRGIESGKTGTHGSKVVITKGDDLYLRYQKNGQVIALIDRITAEQLISLDFLANWGLTLVSRVIERTGVEKVPENDVRTLRMLFEGNSIGVPYLETTWLMEVLGKIGKAIDLERVTEDDLAVAFALSRPAAAGLIDEYVKRRLNPDEIVHIHPVVDEILGESANLVVYQEQTLALAERIGQMDESEREGLRKAISKERGWGVIEKYQEKFVTNATAMGIETEAAVDLFDQIANFGSYGFLEGHVRELMQEIFYPAAYLKRHFPKEFLQEVINLEQSSYFWMGIPEVFVWEADRMGVRVKLKPKGKKGKNGNPIDDEAD